MEKKTNCESCSNYSFDEDYDCYICEVNLDEDEMGRFLRSTFDNCPHFRLYDEYAVVRRQM